MKKLFLLILLSSIATPLLADHLKGGWIQYEYLGAGSSANTSKYRITINQYLNCASQARQVDQVVYMGIFDAGTDVLIGTLNIRHTDSVFAQKSSFSPCISPVPDICYRIDKYTTEIELTNNDNGYTLSVQRCCRIAGIVNVSNSSNVGLTYTNTIPGKINALPYYNNNSPVFAQKDTAVVCYSSPFTFDFSATDIDADSLVYSFTNGILGGSSGNSGGAQPNPPSNPPYQSVPYNSGYGGTTPMGADVTIDKLTGIISGRAPAQTGDYAVAVVVDEYRDGILIGQTRKEIHITVANCSVSAALLNPEYISCNSFTNTFFNESTNPNINTYLWDFGVSGITTDTSHQATPTYTYPDTGVYTIKLTVVAGAGCTDSAKAQVRVFPGFTPDFIINGSCYQNSYLFTDATQTAYGVVDSWSWNFGDNNTTSDTSHVKNPTYKYPAPTSVNVQLIVTNSKGCRDTSLQSLIVLDKPYIDLPFRDTLICSVDTLPLIANGTGSFQWTPNYNIIGANTNNPLVYPKDTTTYIVTLTDRGCSNTDSIKVNVLDFITVHLPADTTICQTDSITLSPVSDGLQYSWTPATGLSSTTIKYPKAAPLNDITYYVEARLGKCFANASTNISVVPYPTVVATGDTTICFADLTTLHAITTAAHYQWSPASSMLYSNTLHPIAGPQATTTYYISVTDTLGCPKPVLDSVLVTVIPPVHAFAGNDTNIVAGQPLQLHAAGGSSYIWSPTTSLNNSATADPILVFYTGIDSIIYTVRAFTPEGCYGDDQIIIKVFTTQPEIFVPSGFTPNADGLNDIIKPILAGMKQLKFFRIYNRWGQQMFYTTEEGKGWNGIYNGEPQASGTYVYTAQAIDYTGKTVERKGTIVLIR